MMLVVLKAASSRLLPLQLGFEHLQSILVKLNLAC